MCGCVCGSGCVGCVLEVSGNLQADHQGDLLERLVMNFSSLQADASVLVSPLQQKWTIRTKTLSEKLCLWLLLVRVTRTHTRTRTHLLK